MSDSADVAQVERNVHAALKSCRWTAARRSGSSTGLDKEASERVITACAKAAMIMANSSVKALVAATILPEKLSQMVRELRSDLVVFLDVLEWN